MLDKDLTFIVQGQAIGPKQKLFAKRSCASIRQFFPAAQIVLSTWSEQEAEGIIYDELVVNVDPGAEIAIDSSKTLNNVNRQLLSTKEGLKLSKTKFSVKVRSDIVFSNNNLKNLLESRPIKKTRYQEDVLEQYVIVTNVTSINPRISLVLPHHPCDWIYAGLTSDLLKIWDIDLMPKQWFRYYKNHAWPTDVWHETNYLSLFRPESYIWSTFLRNQDLIKFSGSFNNSTENILISEKYFALNLMVETNKSLGIKSVKNKITKITLIPSYTRKEWQDLAKVYNRSKLSTQVDIDHFIIIFLRAISKEIYLYQKTRGMIVKNLGIFKRKIKSKLLKKSNF